jgi:hypothetical protein
MVSDPISFRRKTTVFYRYSSAIVTIAESCHYVPDFILCKVVKRARMSHLKEGDFIICELPLEAVDEDAEPTPIEQVDLKGPKVKKSRGWSAAKGGKVAEVISFADRTPLSERQRMATHDQRVMRHSLAEKTPSGLWEKLEAERRSLIEANKTALRWERLSCLHSPKGEITAADFRFGSLRGDREAMPVKAA